ncbi:hypothetical protein AAFF_G00410550 [Aldrovandia affinis]|uniref:Uncharacterized protein n=1 Tax=Aldrovandia affinis TaxID=143900 RepID=A0AAD7WKS1_9TELE|nr:hypothetical protein AAFF_G00410550 [Aldrovandia affinis]
MCDAPTSQQKRLGTEHSVALSKELLCRLIRNTMTNMISIARATEDSRYPSKHEVNAMAKRLVEYYPMIKTAGSVDLLDSQRTQARHYKTLQILYKSKKPNKAAVTHLLNLEFESRRRFITYDVLKEQDRPTKILEAYPCFREMDHVLDELRRIIQPTNSQYISEMKDRWEIFYSKVQFYGIMKKAMKPPKTLNGVVVVSEDNCMIAIGSTPVATFDSERFHEGLLYLMAYYYALHLTYPKCISTLLSVLQTEILQDSIHEGDSTPSYKKAIGEWKSFIEW